jgi:hypothetical protein
VDFELGVDFEVEDLVVGLEAAESEAEDLADSEGDIVEVEDLLGEQVPQG